jgi:hypothetical protein
LYAEFVAALRRIYRLQAAAYEFQFLQPTSHKL